MVRYRKRARDAVGRIYTRHIGAWCVDQLLNEDPSGVVGWSLENLHGSQLSAGVKEGVGQSDDHEVGRWVHVEELIDPQRFDEMGFAMPNENWTEEWMRYSEAGLRYSPCLNLWVDEEGNHIPDPSDPSQKGVFSTIHEGDES